MLSFLKSLINIFKTKDDKYVTRIIENSLPKEFDRTKYKLKEIKTLTELLKESR